MGSTDYRWSTIYTVLDQTSFYIANIYMYKNTPKQNIRGSQWRTNDNIFILMSMSQSGMCGGQQETAVFPVIQL